MLSIRTIIALLALSFSVAVIAAEGKEEKPQPWYQIELILFKQAQPAVESLEQWEGWRKNNSVIDYENSIDIQYSVGPSISPEDVEQDSAEVGQNNNGVLSYREAESIVAESLLRKQEELEQAASEPVAELQPFTFSPVTEWVLGEQYKRLNKSNRYQMLLHTAWIQPGLNKEDAVAVHLHDHMALIAEDDSDSKAAGADNGMPGELINSTVTEKTSPSSAAVSYPLNSTENVETSLFEQSFNRESASIVLSETEALSEITFNGTLKVTLARYLHVDLNLDYAPKGFPLEVGNATNEIVRKEASNYSVSEYALSSISDQEHLASPLYETPELENLLEDENKTQRNVFNMHESRRMRSKKLHYLDHPKIGMLIKIMPVEIPQKDIVESSSKS